MDKIIIKIEVDNIDNSVYSSNKINLPKKYKVIRKYDENDLSFSFFFRMGNYGKRIECVLCAVKTLE